MDNNGANYYFGELNRELLLAKSNSKEEADRHIEQAMKCANELRRIFDEIEGD